MVSPATIACAAAVAPGAPDDGLADQYARPGLVPVSLPSLSVIVPTRRLDAEVAARLQAVRRLLPHAQIILVEPATPGAAAFDAVLASGTWSAPTAESGPAATLTPDPGAMSGEAPHWQAGLDPWLIRVQAARGRGTQCNGGARQATGTLLLFLHDDCTLPAAAPRLIAAAFADPAVAIACFRLRFDRRHWLLACYAWCSRFDSLFTTFGDQGILMRRTLFDALGGFPDWPLFEDVELTRRARRLTRIYKLPAAVTTSAVRFLRHGMLRQQLRNAWLILRYLLGASPAALYQSYEGERPGP